LGSREKGSRTVGVGDDVTFTVSQFQHANGVVNIDGVVVSK